MAAATVRGCNGELTWLIVVAYNPATRHLYVPYDVTGPWMVGLCLVLLALLCRQHGMPWKPAEKPGVWRASPPYEGRR